MQVFINHMVDINYTTQQATGIGYQREHISANGDLSSANLGR